MATPSILIRKLLGLPRKLSIVYLTPYSAPDGLAECDWLKETCRLPSGFRIDALRFQIYESLPEHAKASAEPVRVAIGNGQTNGLTIHQDESVRS